MEDIIYNGCKIEQVELHKWAFYKRAGDTWVKCPNEFKSEKDCKKDIDWFMANRR